MVGHRIRAPWFCPDPKRLQETQPGELPAQPLTVNRLSRCKSDLDGRWAANRGLLKQYIFPNKNDGLVILLPSSTCWKRAQEAFMLQGSQPRIENICIVFLCCTDCHEPHGAVNGTETAIPYLLRRTVTGTSTRVAPRLGPGSWKSNSVRVATYIVGTAEDRDLV